MTATCVRVPVVTTHSLAVHAVSSATSTSTQRARSWPRARRRRLRRPGRGEFPTPADVVGTDPTWVGRVRRSLDDPSGLDLFVCGDNLRKGAALNTAQIAELVADDLAHTR